MFGESWTVGFGRVLMGAATAIILAVVAGLGAYAAFFLLREGATLGEALNFIGGIVGAAFGSGLAIAGAQYLAHGERRRAQLAATYETVGAVDEALIILGDASANFFRGTKRSEAILTISGRAMFAEERLKRLIMRPELTEEAISIGIGAVAIMAIVREAAEMVETGGGQNAGSRAARHLSRCDILRMSIMARLTSIKWYLESSRNLTARLLRAASYRRLQTLS